MLGCICRLLFRSLVLTSTTLLTCLAESNPQTVYKKALPSVMMLEVENLKGEKYVGSAVVAFQNDVALTAWHVVSDAARVWATFADGTRVRVVGYLKKDTTRDLALLKLEKPLPGRQAQLNSTLQPVATRTYVIGAPKGYAFSIGDGLISQIRHVDGFPQYQISCPISPGNSGGPLLDGRGRVVAIVSWSKSDAQNLSFAIPSSEFSHVSKPADRMLVTWQQMLSQTPIPLAPRKVDLDAPIYIGTKPLTRDNPRVMEAQSTRTSAKAIPTTETHSIHSAAFRVSDRSSP